MSLCCVESVRGPMVINMVSNKGNETKANAKVSCCFGMIVVSRRIKHGEQSYEWVQERRKFITFWNFVMF
jgi:hypothetical protein